MVVGIIGYMIQERQSKIMFIGQNINWNVEVIQDLKKEHVGYKIQYIGSDQSIEGFIYQFTSNHFNTKGSDPNKSNVPFVYTMTKQDFKGDPIQEPVQIQIHWNGNKQTIPLYKK